MFQTYLKAFQIGIIAGMRAMSAPALVSHQLTHTQASPGPNSSFHLLSSPKTATVLKFLAGGELIGDKMSTAPNRTEMPQIVGRLLSGGICGAALSKANGGDVPFGALVGGIGAAVGSFAFYQLRHWLTKDQGLPDWPVALAEDALTIGAGLQIVDSIQPKHQAV